MLLQGEALSKGFSEIVERIHFRIRKGTMYFPRMLDIQGTYIGQQEKTNLHSTIILHMKYEHKFTK